MNAGAFASEHTHGMNARRWLLRYDGLMILWTVWMAGLGASWSMWLSLCLVRLCAVPPRLRVSRRKARRGRGPGDRAGCAARRTTRRAKRGAGGNATPYIGGITPSLP